MLPCNNVDSHLTCARGINLIKNDAIWCILSIPKYNITLKSTILRIVNEQQQTLFFSNINPDVHVSTITNTFIFPRGCRVWGQPTRSQRIFLKNQI